MILAFLAAVLTTHDSVPTARLVPLAYLALLAFLSEWFAVSLPLAGTVSTGFAVNLAAVLLFGDTSAGAVALFGGVSVADIRDQKSPLTITFNAAQLALSAMLAARASHLLGYEPLLTSGTASKWSLVGYAATAATVMAVTNVGVVGAGFAAALQRNVLDVWLEMLKTHRVGLIGLALLGTVLAQLYVTAGVGGTLLLVGPFAVTRQAFNLLVKMEQAFEDTLLVFASALEAKDPYTRGHSERVARYACLIARRMGCRQSAITDLRRAALLHDIGKLAYPIDLLTKPKRLTASEYEQLKGHPAIARAILRRVEFLSEAADLLWSHHEHWDGSGYPRALTGLDVDVRSRILAVADSLDAMTSCRAYRSALSMPEALRELRRASGSQFDPRVVVATLELAAEGGLE